MLTRFLFQATLEKTMLQEAALLIPRVFAGLSMAFGHGLGKFPPAEKFVQGVGALGFPAPGLFAWAATLAELAGGVLLALGLLTRPAGLFIAITMVVAGFMRHAADPYKVKELAFIYLAISLLYTIRGAGRLSLDALIWRAIGRRKAAPEAESARAGAQAE